MKRGGATALNFEVGSEQPAKPSRPGSSATYMWVLGCILLLAAIPVLHHQFLMHPSVSAQASDPMVLQNMAPRLNPLPSAIPEKLLPKKTDVALLTDPLNRTQQMSSAAIIRQDAELSVEPDLDGLVSRINKALVIYQKKYRRGLGEKVDVKFKPSVAASVWHTFADAMEAALQDASLHLDAEFPVRTDDSLFISISAYRDHSCRASVRKAYERADHPERLSVGIVQQNCVRNCQQGQGWANTRRLVPSGPDPDCIEEFCRTDLGKPHCDAGRVRILRVGEAEALGPLFARYLNAKLWRGENYFMQIDAHTDFRKGWDSTLIKMIKLTPSFPLSVISNYPPSGTAESNHEWGAAGATERSKGGLCGCTFERIAGNSGGWTVRLAQGASGGAEGIDNPPPYTGFIAAGFFFAHGSIVREVPPDPFLPYIFMGEEIAITLRTWTAGFDIYSPSVDVVSHEYVRSHSIKFWESVGIVFDNGGLHNALTTLIIPRIQHLVGFPEATRPDQVKPADLLTRMSEFSVGKVRTREEFLKMMQIDLEKKRQTSPQWCVQGKAPPNARSRNPR